MENHFRGSSTEKSLEALI